MGSGIPFRASNTDEVDSGRNGDEEDEDEEVDEAVRHTRAALKILSRLAGVQNGQRCCIIRH